MCEDEGTRGGNGTTEATRCGIGGKGTGGLCQWTVYDKVGEAMREILGKAHLSLGGAGFARFEKTCFDCDPDQRRWQPWVILLPNLFERGCCANIIPSSGSYVDATNP